MRNVLLAAALFATPAAVLAEGLSYTYVEGRYFSTDSDARSVNSHGGSLAGSVAIGPLFFIAGDATYGETERFTVGTTNGRFQNITGALRLGVHHPITPTLDIVASGGGLYADVKGKSGFSGNSDNDFGYIAEAGLRLQVIERVELGAFYNYQNIFSTDSSAFKADLQFHVTDKISLVGSTSNGRNADLYAAGLRYRF